MLTFFAKAYLEQGYTVFANYPLNFPFTPIRTRNDLRLAYTGILAMDEFYVWMDSRSAGTKGNKATSYLIFYTRKKKLDFFYTTHRFGNVDIRVRKLTDRRLFPKMVVLESGQAFITCQVFARSENSDKDFIYMRNFTIKANPLFRLYDHTSGIYAPDEDWEKDLGDAKSKKKQEIDAMMKELQELRGKESDHTDPPEVPLPTVPAALLEVPVEPANATIA